VPVAIGEVRRAAETAPQICFPEHAAGRLVPLTRRSPRHPSPPGGDLVLIHAIGGTVQSYAALARRLANHYNVHGIEASGITDDGAPIDVLSVMVDRYIAMCVAALPGPYRLGGWSMGGIVAFEMARRLEAAGAEVSLVALLDSPARITPADLGYGDAAAGRDEFDDDRLLRSFVADVAESLGWSTSGCAEAAADPLGWLARRINGGTDEPGLAMIHAEMERRFRVFRAHCGALVHYAPSGPVLADLLVCVPDRSPNLRSVSRWRDLTSGGVYPGAVQGDHYTFLREPTVDQVADLFGARIDR
jgi:thioesterase domain-containing protein